MNTIPEKFPNLELIDVSIKKRNLEDEIFLGDRQLRMRNRRGQSMIAVMDSSQKIVEVQVLRRGLPKFFDLRAGHIDRMTNGAPAKVDKGSKKAQRQLKLEWNTFMPETLRALSTEDCSLTIHLSEKANGENAQVSYFKPSPPGEGSEEE